MRPAARLASAVAALTLAGCVAARSYDVPRAVRPPSVDGRLDDPAWERSPRSERFRDILGDGGPRPPLATHVRMLWDDDALYVAAEMEEPRVWATLTEHDSVVFHDDDFEVFLDPGRDGRDYAEIEVNAFGTVWDLLLDVPYRSGGRPDSSWESGATVAVRVDGTLDDPADADRGWTVEMAIPWSGLRAAGVAGPPRPGDVWRANFSRVDWPVVVRDGRVRKVPGAPEDNWTWSPQGVVDMHRPGRWGLLRFRD